MQSLPVSERESQIQFAEAISKLNDYSEQKYANEIQQYFKEEFTVFRDNQKTSSTQEVRIQEKTLSESTASGQPQWLKHEVNALKMLKKNIKTKYKKDLPLLEDSKNESVAEVLTNDIYLKFIEETLNAAGEERSKDILNRIQISQGIKQLNAHFEEMKSKFQMASTQET